MDVSLSPSRPPLLGHNSWPDFSPPLPGLSLMTIHRKGSQLVKIKIRPEAVVNRAPTRPRRLTRPREKTGYYRRLVSRRANVSLSGRQSFFTPRRFERIVIDLSRNSLLFLFFIHDSNLSLSRELVYMDATCIRGSKERKSGGRRSR